MSRRFTGWLVVSLGIVVQFLLEATMGRVATAPAILVPLLVYLSISGGDDYWQIEGALWSGIVLDLITQHAPGTSSAAMMAGMAASDWILRITTGAARMTFVAHAFLASVFSDLLFILLAGSPPGSGFGPGTIMLLPRAAVPLVLYLSVPVLLTGARRRAGIR